MPTPLPVVTGFATASRNIVCNAGPYHGQNVIVCTVFTAATARGQKLWSMRTTGRVSVGFPGGERGHGCAGVAVRTLLDVARNPLYVTALGPHVPEPLRTRFFLSRQSQRVF